MIAKRRKKVVATATAIGLLALGLGHVDPAAAQRLTTETITNDVTMPTWAGQAPGDLDRVFILERTSGLLKIFKDEHVLPTPFLNISDHLRARGDGGFMSMAFHPDFQNNRLFYIYYTDSNGDAVVDRYNVSNDPDVADASSRFEIIKIARNPNDDLHAGGFIGFSPTDGYLYITCGDGGPQGDTNNHAQNPQLMMGKILRIDVDGGSPYAIPPDNPFVNDPNTLDEIWAIGFRNPWRAAFDAQTGDLYVADVGYGTWEEVDFIADGDGGRNYGWAIKEGAHCYRPRQDCDPNGLLTDPITEYQHQSNPTRCCIIGGSVYRGESIPLLGGHYFYADFCSRESFSVRYDGSQVVESLDHSGELRKPDGSAFGAFSSFGEDLNGELFVVDLLSGVYRIKTAMHLDVPNLFAGGHAVLTVSGVSPNARVLFLYSLLGPGKTPVPQYDVTLALRHPLIAGPATANGLGVATLSGNLAPGLAGRTLWFQAAEIGNTSDVSRRVVQ